MKKIILLLLFIPLITFGQDDEKPFFINYTSKMVYEVFNKVKSKYPNVTFKTDVSDNKFQYSTSNWGSTVYTFFFNEKGNVTSTERYYQVSGRLGNIDEIYSQTSIQYRPYDNNPKSSNKIPEYKGYDLKDPIEFRVTKYDQNVTVTIGKRIVPEYKRKGSKKIIYRARGVLERTIPDKASPPREVVTDFLDWDLRDEDMVYNIKNYLTSFLHHITSPEGFIGNVWIDDIVNDPKNAVKNGNKWKLNAKDKHLLEKFFPSHKLNCEFFSGQTAKHGHPDDKNKDKEIICPSDFISKEMKIEYRDLEGNAIAMAVGNIFDNGIMHVVIDPIKFKEASPSKRAFIMWHELFHTVGLDHGECGPLMFPYTNEDYTWEDWEAANGEAMKCFISKRNALQGIY